MSRTTQETTMFKPVPETKSVAETIREVAEALKEKGYNPHRPAGRISPERGSGLCDQLQGRPAEDPPF